MGWRDYLEPIGYALNPLIGLPGVAANSAVIPNYEIYPAGTGKGDGMSTTEQEIKDESDSVSAPTVDYNAIADAAIRMADRNLANFPKTSDIALQAGMKAGATMDSAMAERFYSNLESVLPDWRESIIGTSKEMLASAKAITNDLLAGNIPTDVKDAIMRARAEMGLSQGLFGQAASSATARDLGRTSLDLMGQGMDYAVNAVSPLVQRLLSTSMSLTPPVSDLPGLYGANLSAIMPGSMVSPTGAMQAGTQIGIANAEASWAAQLSKLNTSLDLYQTNMQREMNNDAINAQMWSSIIGAGSRFGAALIGG